MGHFPLNANAHLGYHRAYGRTSGALRATESATANAGGTSSGCVGIRIALHWMLGWGSCNGSLVKSRFLAAEASIDVTVLNPISFQPWPNGWAGCLWAFIRPVLA
ncbi:MAG: hypothetical protein M1415_05710 [Firmicutes bacterium]|nr:hypothetical protein [Bacillota bacterium]